MEQFSAKISGLNQRISEENKIAKSLSGLESEIRSVRSGLSMEIKSKQNLQKALGQLADQVNQQRNTMNSMSRALVNVKNEYERTEKIICGYDIVDTVGGIIGESGIGWGYSISAGFQWGIDKITSDFGIGKYEIKKTKRDEISESHYVLEDGKIVKKDKEKSKKTDKLSLNDITIWKAAVSAEGSLLHEEAEYEGEFGSISVSGDIGNVEAHSNFSVTAGGIAAEIGASATALSIAAQGQLGNELLGGHASGSVSAGVVKGQVKASAGWVDKDGNFNPQLGVKASAEALAFEAKGEVGIDLLGTEVNLGGSVTVGVGAHADVGYQDGVLSFDVGASLGIGGSVHLELDVSGAVDALVDCTSDLGSTAMEVSQAVTDYIGETAGATADFVGDVANSTGEFLNKGWSMLTSWL